MIISILSVMIAVLGAVLLSILYLRARNINAERQLKKHRSQDAGLADLLNYAAEVDDGVIVCKSGAFMAAWLYQGHDDASSAEEYREMVAFRINQAFSKLGTGWMVHIDAVRRPAPNYLEKGKSHFPDKITAAIDEERRQFFERLDTLYEGYFVLTVTWYPPLLAERKFTEIMFDDDIKHDKKNNTKNLIESFQKNCLTIESHLSHAIKLTRLCGHEFENEDGKTVTHDDFLRWLQFCVTGINQPIILPSTPIYLDALIGGKELWGGVVPKIGRKFIQVIAIEGFPLESYKGILNSLAESPSEYRWSNRFIFLDAHEAIRELEKYRKKWRQKIRGFFDQIFNTHTGPINQDAVLMTADAEAAIAEINSGLVVGGYYSSVVILMDEDRGKLEDSARRLEKVIEGLGFSARIETINTEDAYFGSLPGHGVENVRRPLINSLNLAHLLPTSTIWTGQNEAPCPFYPPHSPPLMHCVTSGHTPFRLNLHVHDIGHTLIFGPTGAGKSTILALIAAQFRRYKDISIFCFDKGMSMYPLTKAIGGLHFNIAANSQQLAFCPLQYLENKSDIAFAGEWLDNILNLNGLDTSAAQRNEISNAILNMKNSQSKTLSDFSITVQDEKIRETLKPYTIDGDMGYLLDAEQDGLSFSNFTVFEIEELMNMGNKYELPILLYLFRRIERSLHGQPAVILLDEVWLMLAHKVFRNKIREWLKVLRKANCALIMATQSLSDVANSGILDELMESAPTRIFLPNVHARDDENTALYRRMGLNSRQIEIIATAIPKLQYYYASKNGHRLFELALGELTRAIVCASDKESIKTIQLLEEEFKELWVPEWLKMKGVDFNRYGVAI